MPTTWIGAAAKIGVPAVIALWAVWALTTGLGQDIQTIKTHSYEGLNHYQAAATHSVETRDGFRALEKVLQQICVNTANGDRAAQAECFR